ncbi:MAG: hypothetical protein FWB90_07710 [Fibromonadales bacterium]|nr:hypothetical protein [Fibromonadales bacterium]
MKIKIPFLFLLLLSCQGPWSYWPENPENYRGIWIYAYIISGRSVQNVCLDKLHALGETRMQGFEFYESAEIKVSGSFNGKDTSFFLMPNSAGYAENPNCFTGPGDLLADAGKNFELEASITWDSAGIMSVSTFNSKTYIPQKFNILRAYDLEKQPFGPRDTIFYLPPPMDLQANYFVPEYSDDVGGVVVSIVYGNDIYWGENSIDRILEQFRKRDTADHAFFGDRQILYGGIRNQQTGNMNKVIDSIPVMGINMPAIGKASVLFYAATPEYFKFEETFLEGGDSRISPVYNIQGGAGIFAGMLVDTFQVNFKTPDSVATFPYFESQVKYCLQAKSNPGDAYEIRLYHRECVKIWDRIIWLDILCGSEEKCNVPIPDQWSLIPPDALKNVLKTHEIITWCEHRDFPINQYPLCGSMLVRYSKTGKISPILDREVKKWCEKHPDDEECLV